MSFTHYSVIVVTLLVICVGAVLEEVGYSFKYAVEHPDLGIVTHHWEKGHGGVVHGGYSFLDADGKIRVVQYRVDGKKGFKAFVTFRRPPGQFKGHLQYPKHFRTPVRLAEPVSLITPDLFHPQHGYPNLPRK